MTEQTIVALFDNLDLTGPNLTPEQVENYQDELRELFPLGNWTLPELMEYATANGLTVSQQFPRFDYRLS